MAMVSMQRHPEPSKTLSKGSLNVKMVTMSIQTTAKKCRYSKVKMKKCQWLAEESWAIPSIGVEDGMD